MDPYLVTDRAPHAPGTDDPDWQESTFFAWWDDAAGIGGMHRIGHEVNLQRANSWLGIFTRDGRRLTHNGFDIPLKDDDRSSEAVFRVGDTYVVDHSGDSVRWEMSYPGVEGSLELTGFYPEIPLWMSSTKASAQKEMAPRHYENAGSVRGSLRFEGGQYDVNGLFYRDISWGIRRYEHPLAVRWLGGTFGPDLSFGSCTWMNHDGEMANVAVVVRDGEPIYTTDSDVVVYTEPDAYTHRGGWGVLNAGHPSELLMDCELVDGAVFGQRAWQELNTICRTCEAGGRRGFADLHSISNNRGGTRPVVGGLGASVADQLSTRTPPGPRTFDEALRARGLSRQ